MQTVASLPVALPVLENGTLKSVRPDKFGFVLTATGEEAVFFPNECPLALSLEPGTTVQFYSRAGAKGKRAYNVRVPCHQGTVKSLNPTKFGFILTAEGDEAIFYPTDIVPGHSLQTGDVAEYDLKESKAGKKQAINVAKAGAPPAAVAMQTPISRSAAMAVAPLLSGLAALAPALQVGGVHWGTVKSYNPVKGFGFIILNNGEEALVNALSIAGGVPLNTGDSVQFELEITPKGKRANNVRKVGQSAWPVTAPVGGMGTAVVNTGVRETGTVKSYNPAKGFGFIYTAAGDEALVRQESLQGIDTLQPSETVEYEVQQSGRGKRAINVTKFAGHRYKPY